MAYVAPLSVRRIRSVVVPLGLSAIFGLSPSPARTADPSAAERTAIEQARRVREGSREEQARAIEALKQAAVADDGPAQYHLGRLVEEGYGTKRDPVAAAGLYERAMRKGIEPAAVRLAHLQLAEAAHDRRPIDILVAAAEAGNGEAAWILGWAHEHRVLHGTGDAWHKQKPAVAREWLRRLTGVDDLMDRLIFARFWECGSEILMPPRAESWYRRAASSGNAYGYVVMEWELFERNPLRARDPAVVDEMVRRLKDADPRLVGYFAATSAEVAYEPLATMALPGLETLALQEDIIALELLRLWRGRRPEPIGDLDERIAAAERRLAEAGDTHAQFNLAGRLRDDAAATEAWYRLAAAAGHPTAQRNLSRLLRERKDPAFQAETERWMKAAEAQSLD
jgi:TPR repeat protein